MELKDGQQAIDEIHHQGGADAFDIVLTDLQMPHKVPPTAAWLLPLEHLQDCLVTPPCLRSFCSYILFVRYSCLNNDCNSSPCAGVDLVTDFRSLWPKSTVKVVAVTFEDRWEQCLASGFDGWLSKPFKVEGIVAPVRQILKLGAVVRAPKPWGTSVISKP